MKGLRPREGRGAETYGNTAGRWRSSPRVGGRRRIGTVRRRRLAEGLAGARGSSLAGPTVVLGPGPYPEWANTYDGLHMYRPGERAGWRRREDPGGLEMRVASAARPGLEAGVDFGRAWRSAGRGSDQLTPSRSAPATAWVEAANGGSGRRRRAAPQP